jgi:hypothetical protein
MRWADYGMTFVGFRKSGVRTPTMCECSRIALSNFLIKISEEYLLLRNSQGAEHSALNSIRNHVNTDRIAASILDDPEAMLNQFSFAEDLCHVCNRITPDRRYCHPMYGSKFKQHWGWYINQEAMKQLFTGNRFVTDAHVTDAVKQLVPAINELRSQWNSLPDNASNRDARYALEKQFARLERQLDNEYENIVRLKVGYKPIGSRFVSETMLYSLVCELYPDLKIERHVRPAWLEGLELDVYIPAMQVGFEYQGIQHYQPIAAWGGSSALADLQSRDARKRLLCQSNGVTLIEVRYDDVLSISAIRDRLDAVGK